MPVDTSVPTLTPAAIPTEAMVFAPTLVIPALQAGRSIQLASIDMMDAQVGWGVLSESWDLLRPEFRGDPFLLRPEGYILRTADGGKTWQNSTPPTGAYSPQGFFALDANTAWASTNVPCCIDHNTARVWRTRDGGLTWEESQPFDIKLKAETRSEFYLPIQIQFVDSNTGWLLASSRAGMNYQLRSMLLHSGDGGDTWTDLEVGVDGFMQNCSNGGFAFIDPDTGWYGTSCFPGPVMVPFNDLFAEGGWKIRKTIDGGRSFAASTLIPAPPELQELAATNPEMDCGERRVVVFSPNVLGIEWGCEDYETYQKYRYFSLSTDTGNIWNTWTASGNEHFIDELHGWRLLAPGQLQQTTDGGSNWITIKSTGWENAQFDFINEKEGWAIVSIGNISGLLHTLDGGSSWTDIEPAIGP